MATIVKPLRRPGRIGYGWLPIAALLIWGETNVLESSVRTLCQEAMMPGSVGWILLAETQAIAVWRIVDLVGWAILPFFCCLDSRSSA